jgi:hypothetical protein
MRIRGWTLVAVLVGAATLAGCGGGNGSGTPTTKAGAPTKTAAAANAKSVAQETSSILTTGSEQIQADGGGSSQFSDYTSQSTDFSAMADDLQQLDYPSADQSAVQTLETALAHESADAAQIAADVKDGAPTESATAQLQADKASATADSNALKHDLGVAATAPVSSTSTTAASSTASTSSTPTSTTTTSPGNNGSSSPANTESTTTIATTEPTVLDEQGSGSTTTQKFKVPRSATGWTLAWTYECASLAASGNFIVHVKGSGSTAETKDIGPNEVGDAGQATEHYFDTGTFTLEIASECTWSVVAKAVP